MRVFIVAGEPSGDRHAAALVRELLARAPDLEVDAYGMEALRDAGARIVFDMRDLAVMWFMAVVARLPSYFRLVHRTFREWRDRPPDAVVLVDYPGLNLLLARYARRRGIPVVYYIPPQLWAWAPWRRRELAARVDLALTVLPFEAEFLADAGVRATYVGHPLGDEAWPEPRPEDDLVLLMPGSRSAELDAHLSLFLGVAAQMTAARPGCRFALVVARAAHRERIAAAVAAAGLSVELVPAEKSRAVFRRARVAVAKSGTTTLELGLAGVPTVIVYRVGRLARILGRAHMTSPYIGLVNVAAGCLLAPEHLLSTADDGAAVVADALRLMADGAERDRVLAGCAALRSALAAGGTAARAASEVLALVAARSPAAATERS